MRYIKITIRDISSTDVHEISVLPDTIIHMTNVKTDTVKLIDVKDLTAGVIIGIDKKFEVLIVDL